MKNLFRLFYSIGLFSAFSLAITAQTPQPSPTPPISNDTGVVQTFEVRLPVTVVEKKKKKNLVAGLMRSDFTAGGNIGTMATALLAIYGRIVCIRSCWPRAIPSSPAASPALARRTCLPTRRRRARRFATCRSMCNSRRNSRAATS